MLVTQTVCANKLVVTDLCVTTTYRLCSPFSVRAVTSANTPYTLGNIVPFDLVLSDPSGSLLQNPTRFITPESGTYVVTAQIIQTNLQGPGVITGVPVALLEVYVNGTLRRQVTLPYLSFNNTQNSLLTTLGTLFQGEELTIKYQILVMDPLSGVALYPGTVTLIGTPITSLRTFLVVHYLSSICDELDCGTCDVPCGPCGQCLPTSCEPCQPCCVTPCPELICCPSTFDCPC